MHDCDYYEYDAFAQDRSAVWAISEGHGRVLGHAEGLRDAGIPISAMVRAQLPGALSMNCKSNVLV